MVAACGSTGWFHRPVPDRNGPSDVGREKCISSCLRKGCRRSKKKPSEGGLATDQTDDVSGENTNIIKCNLYECSDTVVIINIQCWQPPTVANGFNGNTASTLSSVFHLPRDAICAGWWWCAGFGTEQRPVCCLLNTISKEIDVMSLRGEPFTLNQIWQYFWVIWCFCLW